MAATVSRIIGHKEWTDRKRDPQYSMSWRRGRVAALLAPSEPPPAVKPTPAPAPALPALEDDDMMLVQLAIKDKPDESYLWAGPSSRVLLKIASPGQFLNFPTLRVYRPGFDDLVAAYSLTVKTS